MVKLLKHQKGNSHTKPSSLSSVFSVFQSGEELLPKDASGNIIFDTVDLRDTREVCSAADTRRHCVVRLESQKEGSKERRFSLQQFSDLRRGTSLRLRVLIGEVREWNEMTPMVRV